MDTPVHPSQLSVWHRFLQARRLHRETSRSKNPDWFRPALQLDCQLHLFIEGDVISDAHLCDRREAEVKWTAVKTPELQADEEGLGEFIANLRSKELPGKPRSLGVILHLANEFAISELARQSEKPEDYEVLSRSLHENPQELLEDHSLSNEDYSFRFLPYCGADSGQQAGAAITLSRQHHEYLQMFRNVGEAANFPIRTTALSAPLVALAALPRLTSELPNQPFCIFFSYSTFSVLGFFRQEGELVMLRSVRHHAGGTPPNVGQIVQTMAVALELPEPLVYVLPLSQGRQGEIVAGLPELPNSQMLDWRQTGEFDPDVPFELQGTSPASVGESEPEGMAAALTFREFTERQWPFQDFLPPGIEEEQVYPGQLEMKALRYGGIGIKVAAILLLLFAGWSGLRTFQILKNPAWHSDSAGSTGNSNQVLAKKINEYELWNSFLADRSKAWVTMELIGQIFPDPRAVLLSQIDHTARAERTKEEKKSSLVKEWKITGYANDAALDQLTAINTREGITKVFAAAFAHTGDLSLKPDVDGRNLVVNMLASENKRFDPEKGKDMASQFPFVFNLSVKQRFSSTDPMAIPTAVASK